MDRGTVCRLCPPAGEHAPRLGPAECRRSQCDSLITARVKASFAADPQVSALAINVDTANGIVSLTGVVGSEQERQRAIQLAQGIEGVKHVKTQNLHLRK